MPSLIWYCLLFAHYTLALALRSTNDTRAPLGDVEDPEAVVPHEYLVTLQQNETFEAHFERIGIDFSTTEGYIGIKGINTYVAVMTPDILHDVVRLDPGVLHVDYNQWVEVDTEFSSGESFHGNFSNSAQHQRRDSWWYGVHVDANWGERVVNEWGRLPMPVNDNDHGHYLANAGKGVDIYILDSGVRISHKWFFGDAEHFNKKDHSDYAFGDSADDFNGHGTHVAGIAKRVAPAAKIINVKVWSGDKKKLTLGYLSNAINDVTQAHIAKTWTPNSGYRGAVINMSMRCQQVLAIDIAINKAYSSGIVLVSTSGNTKSGGIVATGYPCRHPSLICVGSSDRSYRQSYFSNYGSNVNILAPGSDIISASITSDDKVESKSGTSMAAPLVAGLVASYIDFEHLVSKPNLARQRLMDNAQTAVLFGLDSRTPNRLANSGISNPAKDQSVPYKGAPANRVDSQTPVVAQNAKAVVPGTKTDAARTGITTAASPADNFEGDVPGQDDPQEPAITKAVTGIDAAGHTVVIQPETVIVTPVPVARS